MDRIRGWIKQLRAAARPGAAEREVRDELAFHLERDVQRNRQRGMNAAEARRAALAAFGSVESVMDDLRSSGLRGAAAGALHDLHHAVNAMRRRPGLALAVVATLGLGIGVSTAMFSIVHGVVLRPLAYPESDRLVAVWETYPAWRNRPVLRDFWDRIGLAWPDFEIWRARQQSFDEVAVFGRIKMTAGGESPAAIDVGVASASLWRVLGVEPTAGRAFLEGENGPGAPAVAVISHALSQARFGAAEAIGRTLQLDGRPFTIIGVLDPAFRFDGERSNPTDAWVPIGASGSPMGEDNHSFTGIGRLRADVRISAAAAEAAALFLGDRRPGSRGAALRPYHEEVVGSSKPPLLVLLTGTVVLLLIACVNAAALFVGDAARREGEVATRRALGATRARIVRQFVAEALSMSLAAAALGAAIAAACVPALIALAPPDLPRLEEIGVQRGVLAFALLGALLTTLICGATSVVVIDRRRHEGAVSSGERISGGGRHAQPIFAGLQLALLTVMVTAAALLGRSLLGARAVHPGFDTGGLLTAVVDVPSDRHADRAALAAFFDRLLARLRALPGVTDVTGVSSGPFTDGSESTSVGVQGLPANVAKPEMQRRVVLDRYFETMRIPVVSGSSAAAVRPASVAVSSSMAARLWPGEDAIGKQISLREQWYTVQAVVGDVRDRALTSAPQGTYYVSLVAAREEARRLRLMLRTSAQPDVVAPLLREVVQSEDGVVAVGEIATMTSLVSRSLAAERYRTLLVNAFAGASLILAAVGICGVTMRGVQRRRREMGVRLALGAPPARLVMGGVGRTAAGAVSGLAIGTALSLWLLPVLTDYLYGLSPRDVGTYAASSALLLAVCLAATAIPLARASRLNVVAALRDE
jgi:putative ABC transport system permease protein